MKHFLILILLISGCSTAAQTYELSLSDNLDQQIELEQKRERELAIAIQAKATRKLKEAEQARVAAAKTEQKRLAEQKRLEARQAEKQRLAEQSRLIETSLKAKQEQKRLAEQKRLEARQAEEQRLAERKAEQQRREAEEKRVAQLAAEAELERKREQIKAELAESLPSIFSDENKNQGRSTIPIRLPSGAIIIDGRCHGFPWRYFEIKEVPEGIEVESLLPPIAETWDNGTFCGFRMKDRGNMSEEKPSTVEKLPTVERQSNKPTEEQVRAYRAQRAAAKRAASRARTAAGQAAGIANAQAQYKAFWASVPR
jgi:hypothetical protein